jgi:hypothetical protein
MTTLQRPETIPQTTHRVPRSKVERHKAIRGFLVSIVVAGAMFALWWLVATTNKEGHHDAELLPIFTLIPLIPAIYHLARARYFRSKGD